MNYILVPLIDANIIIAGCPPNAGLNSAEYSADFTKGTNNNLDDWL